MKTNKKNKSNSKKEKEIKDKNNAKFKEEEKTNNKNNPKLNEEEKVKDKSNSKIKEEKKVKDKNNSYLNKEKDKLKDKQKKNNKKNNKKIMIGVILVLVLILIGVIGLIFILRNPLKKELTIEAGITDLKLSSFYQKNKVPKKASFITDIDSLDLNKVGDYKIVIKENNKEKEVWLHIVDTTSPQVEVQNLVKNIDYEIKAEDFIKNIYDVSKTTVNIKEIPEIKDYQDYKIILEVKDEYQNVKEVEAILTISIIKQNYTLELGDTLKKSDLLSEEDFDDLIEQKQIDEINKGDVGHYEIVINYNNREFKSEIEVVDTTKPTLEVKNLTIYLGDKVTKEDFIKKVNDNSKKVETVMTPEINLDKLGNQSFKIEARDASNNVVEKEVTLTIKKDTDAPVFSGLTTLSVNKNSKIDYYKGVKADDKKDGVVDFNVDTSEVDVGEFGTYYATYTAEDEAGNKVVKKRKIVVNHDKEDTMAKIKEYSLKAGDNYEDIRQYVRNLIKYNANEWGGDDPVWQGLTQYRGNCLVYAQVYKALLEQKGYEVKLIWTTDKSHYWCLVKINGVWRHSDATGTVYHASISAATDDERKSTLLHNADWDRSAWPEAK